MRKAFPEHVFRTRVFCGYEQEYTLQDLIGFIRAAQRHEIAKIRKSMYITNFSQHVFEIDSLIICLAIKKTQHLEDTRATAARRMLLFSIFLVHSLRYGKSRITNFSQPVFEIDSLIICLALKKDPTLRKWKIATSAALRSLSYLQSLVSS